MRRTTTFATVFALAVVLFTVGCTGSSESGQNAAQSAVTKQGDRVVPQPSATPRVNWPALNNIDPSSVEVEAIKAAIARADKIQYDAEHGTYDLSLFPTVFIDDSNVPLSDQESTFLQQVREAQGAAVAAELQGSGWLTCIKAYELNFKREDENWSRILSVAKAEHRNPTSEEIRSVDDGVVGGAGSPRDPLSTTPPYIAPSFIFTNLKVEQNQADVTYDDGQVIQRAFLVKTTEGWKIAGRITLKVHI